MKKIENREDIFSLVTTFYREIRKDETLGPIFNKHIAEDQWPKHLDKLTDFWVTALLGEICFKGNPSQAHLQVDKGLNHNMNKALFDRWLQLWFATIDSLFVGDIAQRAKDSSKNMAIGQRMFVESRREA